MFSISTVPIVWYGLVWGSTSCHCCLLAVIVIENFFVPLAAVVCFVNALGPAENENGSRHHD